MPVKFRDYYEVLGVARDASAADIKKAFRKLAHMYHPDVAKDRSTAEAKFKELNEANEVLSDPEKRRRYDELGANWNHPERQQSPPQGGFAGGRDEAPEFHFEGTGFSDFFEQFFGSRGRAAHGFGAARAEDAAGGGFGRRGQDIEGDILVTLDEVLHGSARIITLQRTDPRTGRSSTQNLRVKISPGVHEGQLVRLAGKGGEGAGGGEAGNLYLRVKYATHPDFRVQGSDLYCDVELAPWEAVLGATVRVSTLDGTVSLKIPPGTAGEQRLRLRGKGLPAGDGTRGHLYAVVSIQVPTHLTAEQRQTWEQLAATSTFNPRQSS